MAPVKLKYIVSFTSQDDFHKASNLINGGGIKKWLCHPKDRNGKIEIVVQLEEATQFSFIDIGTLWCASLEINVGKSDWPLTSEYKTLVPMVSLMSPIDCQLGRKTTNTQMFTSRDFSNAAVGQKWDRIQIICRQPYRKDMQLGISFIRIRNSDQVTLSLTNSSKDHGVRPSPQGKNLVEIKKHFFGNSNENKEQDENSLKQRLLQISSSSDNGCGIMHEESLSRTAQLVLKAREKTNKSNAHYTLMSDKCKRGLFSDTNTNKTGLTLDEEMAVFLPTLNLSMVDFDSVTVKDLRHKFERKKKRKLSPPERRKFSEQCQKFMLKLCETDTSADNSLSLSSSSSVSNCPSNQTIEDNQSKITSINPAFRSPPLTKRMIENQLSHKLSPAAIMRKENHSLDKGISRTSNLKTSKLSSRSKSNRSKSKDPTSSSESSIGDESGSDIFYNSSSDGSDRDCGTIDDVSPTHKTQVKRKIQTLEDVNRSYQDLYKTFVPEKGDDYRFHKKKRKGLTSAEQVKVAESGPYDIETEKDDGSDSCTSNSKMWLSATSNKNTSKPRTKKTPVTPKSVRKSVSQTATRTNPTPGVNEHPSTKKTFQWPSAKDKEKVSSHQGHLLGRLVQAEKYFSSTVNKGSSSLLCKVCGFLIPQDTYDAHCATCASPAGDQSVNQSSSTSAHQNSRNVKGNSSTVGFANGGVNRDIIDLTQPDFPMCPICLNQFPQEILMAHASECGL